MDPITLGKIIHEAADDKKAADSVFLDVTGSSDLCNFVYICSAENEKQAQAIAESIDFQCKKKANLVASAVEGKASGSWVLLDYSSVMVHVFLRDSREYYHLEDLFPNAKKISL